MTPIALLIPADDIALALKWYQRAFPEAEKVVDEETNFSYLKLGPLQLEPVWADHKVPSARAGTVLYWAVDDLQTSIDHFKELGSFVYRGPMEIGQGQGMCQVTDPFGNLIGLRGPFLRA